MASKAGLGAGMKIKFRNHMPGSYMNIAQKMARGIWPWPEGPRARLPMHYKLRYMESKTRDPIAVHYEPDTRKYKVGRDGCRLPVQNVPVPLIFPKEANDGLWGGEGFLQGKRKKNDNPKKNDVWHLWKPFLTDRAFHSEILDKYLQVTVSLRTLDLVDEAKGFDHYILGTHEVDLRSMLGMKLKRLLLTTLLDKSMYPNEPEKRDEVYKKYEKYLIPREEVEWVGLTIEQAERKQLDLDEVAYQASIKPLKEQYMNELVETIRNSATDELSDDKSSDSWSSRLNPMKWGKS